MIVPLKNDRMEFKTTKAQIYEEEGARSRLRTFFYAFFHLALLCSALELANSACFAGSVDSTSPARSGEETGAVQDSNAARTTVVIPPGLSRTQEPGVFDMLTNLPSDWRDWAVRNFTWDKWPVYTAVTASTAAMIVYDNELWVPFKKLYETNSFAHDASDVFVSMGDGKFQFGLAAAFAGYGVIAGDRKALRTASQTVEVILACGAVVQLLKHVTGRESPIVTTTPTGVWKFFPSQIEYHKHVPHYDAFPSGHLATATATLTVISNNYPDVRWIKPVGYVCLAGIATGLAATSIHWWSDFPLALALGYSFGTLLSPNPDQDVSVKDITHPETEHKDIGSAHMQFYPTFADGSGGLGMSLTW
jgi:membrane-associated phospholipid phosphatase